MKIKRMTFTKIAIYFGCIFVSLCIMYRLVPTATRVDFPSIYMVFTLVFYELGKFIAKNLIKNDYEGN